MADTASPYGIYRNPSKMGRLLSFIWKFSVDATIADLLAGVNGRKKVHELVQQKAKVSPPPPPLLLLNYKRRPWDFDDIVHNVQRNRQERAGRGNSNESNPERCVKYSKGTEPSDKMMQSEANKESDHPASN